MIQKEKELKNLKDEDLKRLSLELKERVKKGESLDNLLVPAFALVRETAKRTLGQRHYDVQLLGGIVLHQGKIAEMATGEGKTLTATLPLYLNALEGKGCHLVTVNDYLAKRDTVWMGQIYHFLGLKVGCVTSEGSFLYDPNFKASKELDQQRDTLGSFKVFEDYLKPVSKKEAYLADITYGTNNEFGFDYLRDNLVYDISETVQRGHYYAIVDEIDSILIDEARTPLIISMPDEESPELYKKFAKVVAQLKEGVHFNIDEKMRVVTLTEEGINKVEEILGVKNLYTKDWSKYLHYLEQSLKAFYLFKKDRDYVVKNGEVIIVDEFTGRLLPGRRYSEGLHQAIEAKEGVEVKQESKTLATITFQNYFRMYKKLAGMTGTAKTSAEEFYKVYGLEVITIPTNKPMIRKDHPDKVFKTKKAKFEAVVQEIKKRYQKGQPVLVGTTSIENNEYLSKLLEIEGIPHQVLNAKNHQREGEIIAQAGKLGAVTVATNMAGRGVDIILGGNPPDPPEAKKVKELGGLFVLGTERHESRRIDNQLRGRAGRQGDPGETQFFLSLEDDLIRIFGGERVKALLEKFNFPESEPISSPLINKVIEEAQAKVEGFNFDLRKHLLEYDEVLNKQREKIYSLRREILTSSNLFSKLLSILEKEIKEILIAHTSSRSIKEWNIEEILEDIKSLAPNLDSALRVDIQNLVESSPTLEKAQHSLLNFIFKILAQQLEQKREKASKESFERFLKVLFLSVLDNLWSEHLTLMDYLRDSVRLRALGQLDPLVEYKQESFKLFQELLRSFQKEVVKRVFQIEVREEQKELPFLANLIFQKPELQTNLSQEKTFFQPVRVSQKIGRNDPCPCGSGKKWKKCGLLNTKEHQENMARLQKERAS